MSPGARAPARVAVALGLAGSALVLALPALSARLGLASELTGLEAAGVVALAWSVALLARNHPLGWWVGLVGVACYAVVFQRARLYGEVALQGFYFVTSLWALWLWHRGPRTPGAGVDAAPERPVTRLRPGPFALVLLLAAAATWALRGRLAAAGGAAPLWDALTTVVSVAAHVLLMRRHVESWPLWVLVDAVYVPLYASRGLWLTSGLYAVFLALAARGWWRFARLAREHAAAAPGPAPGGPA